MVGLSERAGSTGRRVVANIEASRFAGTVYGVHPSGQAVDGVAVYPSLAALPAVPDVVVIGTPAPSVAPLVEEAGALGCRAAVVFAGGFEETPTGREGAADLRRAAGRHGVTVVGPNGLGVFSPQQGLWLTGTFLDTSAPAGPVAVVSQTGSACILLSATGRLGLSHVISSGNETVTSSADFVEALLDDPGTRVIALVVEGVSDGPRLAALARRARRDGVDVVALKIGRSALGARTAASHTGAVAGDARRYDAFFRRHQITTVADLDELVETLVALSTLRTRPCVEGVAVVGLSGGELGMVADAAAAAGLPLVELAPATGAALAALLPGFGAVANPLDATGQLVGDPARFREVAATIAADPAVGLLVVVLDSPPGLADRLAAMYHALLAVLPEVRATTGTPTIVLSNHAAGAHPGVVSALAGSDIPVVRGTRAGVAAIAAVVELSRPPGEPTEDVRPRYRGDAVPAVRHALRSSPGEPVALPLVEQLLAEFGIPGVRRARAASAGEARAAADALGYPVALKTADARVIHKSDVGAVRLALGSGAEVEEAYAAVVEAVQQSLGSPSPAVVVEEMVTPGVEAFVGTIADPALGAMVALGPGGTLVELFPPPAVVPAPVSEAEARSMLDATPLGPLVAGYRGRAAGDVDALVELVVRVGELAHEMRDEPVTIDLNPVAVLPAGHGVRVLDARIVPLAAGPAPRRAP